MSDTILYEGKAKQLIPTEDENILIQRFKDEATAFNGEKFAVFPGKGAINCAIATLMFERLEAAGIRTHFLSQDNSNDMRVRRLEIIPLEVVVRNVAAGSLAKRLGWDEGTRLPRPIVETYYKKDELGDPILAPVHVDLLGLVSPQHFDELEVQAREVNEVMLEVFGDAGLDVIDFKLEFGLNEHGALLLGDEISPDTCRLWDVKTGAKHDKDVFRRDLADLVETYLEVARRLGLSVEV